MALNGQTRLRLERTWREIAEELWHEMDPGRLVVLWEQLLYPLDAEKSKLKKPLPDNCIPFPDKRN
jgi:hypothetical protein